MQCLYAKRYKHCTFFSLSKRHKSCGGKRNFLALFPPIRTSEPHIPHVSVSVIALHSQMPLKIFDPLTNSPFQRSHHGNSLEMYTKRRKAQKTGREQALTSQMGRTTSIGGWNISQIIEKIAQGHVSSLGKKTLDFPKASRKQIHKEHCLRCNTHALKPS